MILSVKTIYSGCHQTSRKLVITFVNSADFEEVIVSVAFLLKKNPKAEFWTTYQERRLVYAQQKLFFLSNLLTNCTTFLSAPTGP